MAGLPAPPDAYWAGVPWWGYLGFLVVALLVCIVLGPWMVQRARSRPSAMLSREQALAVREAAQQARQDAEIDALRRDRERGWNLTRGWAVLAHDHWHAFNNLAQRFNVLLTLAHRVAEGKLSPEGLSDRLADFRPEERPERLPAIEAAPEKRPGETKYA